MRRAAIALVGLISLAGCGPVTSHARISQAAAIKSALADVQALERYRANQLKMPPATGFTVSRAYVTRHTASITASSGNVVTLNPAPAEAWIIEFAAPPQGIWTSVSALEVVDSSTGVAAGGGLWAVPIGAPIKGALH
jgi:hypothetical protein